MTIKQKVFNYIRTHKEPFTVRMLAEETGITENNCRKYLSLFMADQLVAFAEPKSHDRTPTPTSPWGRWKERKYKQA